MMHPVSGQGILSYRLEAERGRVRMGHERRRFNRSGGQIEPLPLALTHGRQTDPVQDRRFVLVEVENDGGRRAVEEVQSSEPVLALNRKPSDAVSGEARQGRLPVGQRKENQIDQTLVNAAEMTTQTEQALAVLAECGQTDGDRSAIRPKNSVTFIVDFVLDPITRSISAEK
jgi:hypothetical protein